MKLFPEWLFVNGLLLLSYYALARKIYSQERPENIIPDQARPYPRGVPRLRRSVRVQTQHTVCVATGALLIGVAACSPDKPPVSPGQSRRPDPPVATPTATATSNQPRPAPPATRSDPEAIGGQDTIEIDAPSYTVMGALCRPEAAWRVLPHVAGVEDLGSDDGDHLWRLTHKYGLFTGGYVLRVRKDWGEHGRHTIRFWIDTRYDRDVDDAWGYFHLVPIGGNRTRLHYRVRAVLLPGIIRWLFTEKIQWALMSVPSRTRTYFDENRP